MDKFEENMKKMESMSDMDKEQNMNEIKGKCTCPSCPSYNDCAKSKNEQAYCAVGKSPSCITIEKECICPDCPVTEMMGLDHIYFCTKGTEKQQRL
jgi:hypothetical protein